MLRYNRVLAIVFNLAREIPVSLLAVYSVIVVGGTEHGHENLRKAHLACILADNGHGLPGIVHKQFFTGSMGLAHGALLLFKPGTVQKTVLRVTVTAVGVRLGIFFPEQVLGDAFTLEFTMHFNPVRAVERAALSGVGIRVKLTGELQIIELFNDGPVKLKHIGGADNLLYRPQTDPLAVFDLPHTEARTQPQAEYFT